MVALVDPHPADDGYLEHRVDGGITAWLQVFGSWILFLNSWFVEQSHFSACRQREKVKFLMNILGGFLISLERSSRIIPPFFCLILALRA